MKAWERVYKEKAFANLGRLEADSAKELLKTVAAVEATYGDHPCSLGWKVCREQVAAVAARQDDKGRSLATELRKLFEDRLLRTVNCITTAEGVRYYVNELPSKKEGKLSFKYIKGFDFSEEKAELPSETLTFGPAPQQELSRKLLASLAVVEEGKWESGFYSIFRILLEDADAIDPVLRLVLLKRSLDIAQQGSFGLRQAFSELRESLENQKALLATNWLDPQKADVTLSRDAARNFMLKVGSVDEYGKSARETFLASTAPPQASPIWVGCLLPNGEAWEAGLQNDLASGELLVLHLSNTAAQFSKVADVSPRGIAWLEPSQTTFRIGRPLFFRPLTHEVGFRNSP